MKRAVNLICALDLLFLFLLSVSSFFSNEVLSEITYYIAFLLPTALGVMYVRRECPYTENPGSVYLKIGKREILYFLPLIAPTLILIIAISALSSGIMGLFGLAKETVLEGGIFYALTVYALLPAVLEEFLFRYIPLKVLLPYSKSVAVFISALFFALVHADLFVIPYALVAGSIFALIDIKCESVIPSFAIHLFNNILSVLMIKSVSDAFTLTLYAILGILGLASAIAIALARKKYRDLFEPVFIKEKTEPIGYSPIIMLILSLSIAITALIA